MNIIGKRAWEMPEHLATPEHLFFNRRQVLAGLGLAGGMVGGLMPLLNA